MRYWQGTMDWPIPDSWNCLYCGAPKFTLIWGMQHGVCRCEECHVVYDMGNRNEKLPEPVSRLKDAYTPAFKWAWEKWRRPLDQLADDDWDKAIAATDSGALIEMDKALAAAEKAKE